MKTPGVALVPALCFLFHVTSGLMSDIGRIYDKPKSLTSSAKGGFLLENYALPKGAVIAFTATFLTKSPVLIQVWRPVNFTEKKYNRVRQYKYTPATVPETKTINLKCGEYLHTNKGDRIGIWNEENSAAIGYRLHTGSGSSGIYRYSTRAASDVPSQIQFSNIEFPYLFSLIVHVDSDDWKYSGSCASAVTVAPWTPPTPAPTPAAINLNITAPYRYLGNTLSGVTGTVIGETRRTYIIQDLKFPDAAVITEVYAYFVATTAVRFQIWRLFDVTSNAYKLIGELRFQPPKDKVPGMINIPLTNDTLLHVQKGDFLGITSEDRANSVAYKLETGSQEPSVFVGVILDREDFTQRGDTVKFDTLTLPYYFAVGVKYDEDLSTYPTASPIPTPASTTPISIGPNRNLLGRIFSSKLYASTGAHRIYIMINLAFPSDGFVQNFTAYVVNRGRIRFQVWRLVSVGKSDEFVLVGEVQTNVTRKGTNMFSVEPHIEVKKGDVIGYTNEGNVGLVAYRINTKSAYVTTQVTSSYPITGERVIVDALPLPYEYSMSATYQVKEVPTTTSPPNTGSPKTAEIKDGMASWLVDPRFILALLIWLVIITLLLFLLLIYLVCRKNEQRDRFRYGSWASGLPPPHSGYNSWSSDMKDDENIDYFNPTIGSRPKMMPQKTSFTNSSKNGEVNRGYTQEGS